MVCVSPRSATRLQPQVPSLQLKVLVCVQVRQDAVLEMSEDAKETPLDFVLVVGGWDSSNTARHATHMHAAHAHIA